MAKRYPQEVKDEAAALYAEGLSIKEVSSRLGLKYSTTQNWVSPKVQVSNRAYQERIKEDPAWKARHAAAVRKYAAKPESKELRRQWRNALGRKEYERKYRATAKHKEYKREYYKGRYATEPAYRTLQLLRRRTARLLNASAIKSGRTQELLGISTLELAERWDLEYGANWYVDTSLHIDHVRPCSCFDFADPAQQRLCFNWRNLQLLPAQENLKKNDSWTEWMEQAWVERMRKLGWEGELFLIFSD